MTESAELSEVEGASKTRRPSPLMIATWEAATTDPDPLAALGASRALVGLLSTWESRLAGEAVAAGATWESIGGSVGVSRQAAWERFHHDVHAFRDEVKEEARTLRDRQRKEWDEFKDNVKTKAKERRRHSR